MKTYNQFVKQALIDAAYAHFNGGYYLHGIRDYINLVETIYGVDSYEFMKDVDHFWNILGEIRVRENMYADDLIKFIKNHDIENNQFV